MIEMEGVLGAQQIGPMSVVLHVWGFTQRDAEVARIVADHAPGMRRWKVVAVIESVGPPCTIESGAPGALDHGAHYEWKWALYPPTNPAETQAAA